MLGKLFFSLHRAEMGLAGEKEDELFLPQNVRIPAAAAPASVRQQCNAEAIQRGKLSLVASLFGMDVQVCNLLLFAHLNLVKALLATKKGCYYVCKVFSSIANSKERQDRVFGILFELYKTV